MIRGGNQQRSCGTLSRAIAATNPHQRSASEGTQRAPGDRSRDGYAGASYSATVDAVTAMFPMRQGRGVNPGRAAPTISMKSAAGAAGGAREQQPGPVMWASWYLPPNEIESDP